MIVFLSFYLLLGTVFAVNGSLNSLLALLNNTIFFKEIFVAPTLLYHIKVDYVGRSAHPFITKTCPCNIQ